MLEMQKLEINIALLIFTTYFILDMFYAYYILCIESRQNLMSSFMAGMITSLSAFVVVSFSKNMLYVVPLFLGGVCWNLFYDEVKRNLAIQKA